MARVILTQPGEDVDVGGDLTVFGTRSGGEVITVLQGTIVLDPSFNAGGDTVRLPDDAAFFTIRLIGSSVILQGLSVTVTIPVGTAGLLVAFNDVSRTLLFDSAAKAVKLGDQVVTSLAANVVPAGGPATLSGTAGADIILGTEGNDVIDGLGGADRIDGGAGNDVLRGGAGGDDLDGSFGNDQLFGGPDADRLTDTEGASARLDGGTGNDWLSVENFVGTSFELVGGDGDDTIEVAIGLAGTCLIDAGAGADRVLVITEGITVTATLGADRDELVLPAFALGNGVFGVIRVTDFQAGTFGDTVDYVQALADYALNWDQSGNPFASGHLRLIDRDGAAVLQVDRDGSAGAGFGFRDLIIFSGVSTSALTGANLQGFDPRPPVQQEAGAEMALEPHHGFGLLMWEQQAFA